MIEVVEGVTPAFVSSNCFPILVNDRFIDATLSLAPLYDPQSTRVLG